MSDFGKVVFVAGTRTVDVKVEPDELVVVTIAAGTGYTIGTPCDEPATGIDAGTLASDPVPIIVGPATIAPAPRVVKP